MSIVILCSSALYCTAPYSTVSRKNDRSQSHSSFSALSFLFSEYAMHGMPDDLSQKSGQVSVEIASSNGGLLSLNTLRGLRFELGSGINDERMKFVASVEYANDALYRLGYMLPADEAALATVTSDKITITVSDRGGTGAGAGPGEGALQAVKEIEIANIV